MKVTSNKNASEKGHTDILIKLVLTVFSVSAFVAITTGLSVVGTVAASLLGGITGFACYGIAEKVFSDKQEKLKQEDIKKACDDLHKTMTPEQAVELAGHLNIITNTYNDKMPEESKVFLEYMVGMLNEGIKPKPEFLRELYKLIGEDSRGSLWHTTKGVFYEEAWTLADKKKSEIDHGTVNNRMVIYEQEARKINSMFGQVDDFERFDKTSEITSRVIGVVCAALAGMFFYKGVTHLEHKKAEAKKTEKAQPKPAATTSSATIHTVDWQALVAAQKLQPIKITNAR